MKRLCVFLACLVLVGINLVQAQTVRITGTVTSSEDGMAIPGVSVVVKGTTNGVATNIDGKFELNVGADAQTLLFSSVGFKAQEIAIGGRSIIDVVLASEAIQVDELVITSAYGIKRTPKGSTSLAQVVTGEKLNEVRQTNVNNALAGKVSGIQVRSQSSAKLGSSGTIRLRGDGGFSTGQGVLYVVDGTIISDPGDINMDNVEDVNVLSGPGASAILGSQGANGAIIITTKKAKVSKTANIDISTGATVSSVYIMPQYQNSYGGGGSNDFYRFDWNSSLPAHWATLDGKYYPDYTDDASWGPRLKGQEYIPWYAWYEGTKYTGKTATWDPQPSNSRDFFDKGVTTNTTIAISKAVEGMDIRVVYGRIDVKGLIPNSSLKKNTFTVKGSFDATKRLTIAANVNFNSSITNGEFDDGYSNQSTGSFNQWFHRDIDMNIMKELKNLKTPEGVYASWNHMNPGSWSAGNERGFYAGNYWYNFYTWFDKVKIPQRNDKLFGDVSASYKITKDLTAKVTYRRVTSSIWGENTYSSDLMKSGLQTQGNSPEAKGFYRTYTQYSNRDNYETLLSYSKTFSDFKVNANAGSDFFNSILKYNNAQTVDGLNVPYYYAVNNSKSTPSVTNTRSAQQSRAVFVRGDVSFKDYLFADFTIRNDWYSVLPPANNKITSKSFGASFVFSDLLKLDFMNFGKVRYSWGEIPMAIAPYDYPGMAYTTNQYSWGKNPLMTTPDTQVDANIRGAVKTMKDIGIELRFFDSMLGLNATYWNGTENNIPYSVSIAGFSGYASRYMNTGEISKKGIDLALNVRAIANDNYRWDIGATFAYLMEQKIVKIDKDGTIKSFVVQGMWTNADGSSRYGAPVMVHEVGKQWGQLVGGGIKYVNGKQLLDAKGMNIADQSKHFGSVLPKFTGGVQNSIRFLKDFTATINIDYQVGGQFFSLSDMWGTYSGLTKRTAGVNDKGNPVRDAVADGGGVHVVGVTDVQDYTANPSGAPIYVNVDKYVEGQAYYHSFVDNGVQNYSVYDLSFVKLRELSIGYNIPVKKLKLGISSATFSLVAQNPWLIYAKNRDYDPSEISFAAGEAGQFPGVRTWGANLKISF